MSKNPFLNALAASLYITFIASVLYYGPKITPHVDAVIVPIVILSLFVLSAAIMGYLFLYEPAQLFLEGEKKKATQLFLQTVGVFALITLLILVTLLYFGRI
ncbi:MAG: hypothetical protein Q8R36_02080 [bacterium]|nr:hypothetical protein [bacterium]